MGAWGRQISSQFKNLNLTLWDQVLKITNKCNETNNKLLKTGSDIVLVWDFVCVWYRSVKPQVCQFKNWHTKTIQTGETLRTRYVYARAQRYVQTFTHNESARSHWRYCRLLYCTDCDSRINLLSILAQVTKFDVFWHVQSSTYLKWWFVTLNMFKTRGKSHDLIQNL